MYLTRRLRYRCLDREFAGRRDSISRHLTRDRTEHVLGIHWGWIKLSGPLEFRVPKFIIEIAAKWVMGLMFTRWSPCPRHIALRVVYTKPKKALAGAFHRALGQDHGKRVAEGVRAGRGALPWENFELL